MIVFKAAPVDPKISDWMTHLLTPFWISCRLKHYPVEIKRFGPAVGGFCESLEVEPSGRVQLSHSCRLWSKNAVVETYLHEVTHRLLFMVAAKTKAQIAFHGVEFSTLLAVLFIRSKANFEDLGYTVNTPLGRLSFYDCADRSLAWGQQQSEYAEFINWWTEQLKWTVQNANAFASLDLNAEDVAFEIVTAWRAHVHSLNVIALRKKKDTEQTLDTACATREPESATEEQINAGHVLIAGVMCAALASVATMLACVYFLR
jgi:hypothetical protein